MTEAIRVVGAPGSTVAVAPVSVAVAVALLAQRRRSALAARLVAVLGDEALNLAPKGLFARPRPRFEHPLVIEASYSFPRRTAPRPAPTTLTG